MRKRMIICVAALGLTSQGSKNVQAQENIRTSAARRTSLIPLSDLTDDKARRLPSENECMQQCIRSGTASAFPRFFMVEPDYIEAYTGILITNGNSEFQIPPKMFLGIASEFSSTLERQIRKYESQKRPRLPANVFAMGAALGYIGIRRFKRRESK